MTVTIPLDDLVRGWDGGVDVPRVRGDVLGPLLEDHAARYQRHDWEGRRLAGWLTVGAGGVIVDGSAPAPAGQVRILVDRGGR